MCKSLLWTKFSSFRVHMWKSSPLVCLYMDIGLTRSYQVVSSSPQSQKISVHMRKSST